MKKNCCRGIRLRGWDDDLADPQADRDLVGDIGRVVRVVGMNKDDRVAALDGILDCGFISKI